MTYQHFDKRAKDEQLKAEQTEAMKDAFKEAIHEWLDEKFATFGRWTITTVLAGALAAVVYLICWVEMKKGGL